MKNSNLKIAITGGIGSGKSTAAAIIKEMGYTVLSSDTIVSDLYRKRRVKKLLKSIFPGAVKGTLFLKIDRKKIAAQAFNDQQKHKQLTDTITPLVLNEILSQAEKTKILFAEVPLLFECNYQKYFDQVIVVVREKSARITSVKSRSALTEEQVIARMQKQIDYDNFDLSPFVVIENNGSKYDLKEKVLSAVNAIK
ncbi:MAG: dephospho-CoA kinase [Clostridia bacterium]|nr:dephospho-CoA kinase [Clostridia bacterium]